MSLIALRFDELASGSDGAERTRVRIRRPSRRVSSMTTAQGFVLSCDFQRSIASAPPEMFHSHSGPLGQFACSGGRS